MPKSPDSKNSQASPDTNDNNEVKVTNFIYKAIEEDTRNGRYDGRVHTRFPPEPNGYIHIGSAKAIWISYGAKLKYGGQFNLRFDDTNPLKEDVEFIDAIQEDLKWLGCDWDNLCFASSYFDELYELAIQLIKKEKAYVCSLKEDELREFRGNLTKPGKDSPYRNRSVEENLDLFERMKNGEFKEGEHVLRAKIDMSSGNMNMRDPLIYRIRFAHHPVTGDKWCIYPLYDFTHGISDAIEGITHSLCSLEFEDHRPLYDWFLKELEYKQPPRQIEFSKLALSYLIMGKRKLIAMVEEGLVNGWDDPRMPTVRGMRRRGFTANSIRTFCEEIGVTKSDSVIDMSVFEEHLRQDLNSKALRKMAVLSPLKVTITDYPPDKEEMLEAPNHPQKPEMGHRDLPFSSELYIDRDDFLEDPPKKFFRLKPGGEVRLRNSYVIKCEEVIKDDNGNITELKCTHDANTLGKNPEGRKVKGIIHWISAKHCLKAEVRLYDRMFNVEDPGRAQDFREHLNPDSLKVLKDVPVEPSLAQAKAEDSFQFERVGYFCVDSVDSRPDSLVFNRSVTLRDAWAKEMKKN